ncbi:MAG: hypothetical protein ACNA7V_12585, partial [Bacteroidales bacterium]
MKSFRTILVLPVLIMLALNALSQNDPLLRIEIETKTDDAQYRVIPCNQEGAILLYPTTNEEEEYKFWIALFYDRFLQEVWMKNIPLFRNMKFHDYLVDHEFVYLFFYISDQKKTDMYNFQLARIHMKDGIYELFSSNLSEKA